MARGVHGERRDAGAETERVRRIWDKVAPNFDKRVSFWERVLFSGGREWVCSHAQGDVLEIAVGTGRNLEHYPEGVRLVGIELSPVMLELAQRRAASLGREVDLRLGDAQSLEFPDETFDTVTCTISLCSIPDDRQAVSEVKRVLRRGGRFVLMEHVRSPLRRVRAVQRLIDPITVRFEGDHVMREPAEHIRDHGFVIERQERSKLGIVERLIATKPRGS